MSFPKEPVGPPIVEGGLYRYLGDLPRGCKGGIYKVERFILDVPSYQEKVLVQCVEGLDRGLWFTCAPWNFCQRYERVPPAEPLPIVRPADPPAVGWTADMTSRGKY